jgi:hypothetical protein
MTLGLWGPTPYRARFSSHTPQRDHPPAAAGDHGAPSTANIFLESASFRVCRTLSCAPFYQLSVLRYAVGCHQVVRTPGGGDPDQPISNLVAYRELLAGQDRIAVVNRGTNVQVLSFAATVAQLLYAAPSH